MGEVAWKTRSKYVDLDSGEELTLFRVKKEYHIIKHLIHKNVTVNRTTNKGVIEYTYPCRRSDQARLPFD